MTPDSTPVIEGPFPSPESHGQAGSASVVSGGDAVILHLTGPHRGTRQHLTDVQAVVEGWSPGGDRLTFTAYTGRDVFDLTTTEVRDVNLSLGAAGETELVNVHGIFRVKSP